MVQREIYLAHTWQANYMKASVHKGLQEDLLRSIL